MKLNADFASWFSLPICRLMDALPLGRLCALGVALWIAALSLPTLVHGQQASGVAFRGVNLAGAEFGSSVPGRMNTDYVYPLNEEIDYYLGEGMNVFRIPFKWERLQPELDGPLSPPDIAEIDRIVEYATSRNAFVVLDPHNYGRRWSDGTERVIGETSEVTSEHFSGFWAKLASRYKENANVIFGLMNEPHDQNGEVLLSVLNDAIRAIRETGAANLILTPGNSWTGAHSWVSSGNGELMLGIEDPADNYAFDVHQYLDANSGGSTPECVEGAAERRLQRFTDWARSHGRWGFLGEFGVAASDACLTELDALLEHIHANSDVWLGWTYWAGGPWWGDYQFTLEPASLSEPVDRPQMEVMEPYLARD